MRIPRPGEFCIAEEAISTLPAGIFRVVTAGYESIVLEIATGVHAVLFGNYTAHLRPFHNGSRSHLMDSKTAVESFGRVRGSINDQELLSGGVLVIWAMAPELKVELAKQRAKRKIAA